MPKVYIALGSNLGDREERVLRAVHEMRSFSMVRKISTLVETDPEGGAAQPKYINAVVEIDTDFSPKEVMNELLLIEENMGRVRAGEKGGSREIDLDILAYDDTVIHEGDLEVPHPRMHLRRFVLEPLKELNPNWRHPVLGKTVSEILSTLA